MNKNNKKEALRTRPVEQHITAAWANIEKTQEASNVAVPSESQAENAKEWVAENQK